jgi:uncharacterized protein (TIGR03067 family)
MHSTRLLALLSAVTMILASARPTPADGPARDDAVKKEMKALQGTWQTVAAEEGGQNIDAPPGLRPNVKIDGEHYDTLYPGSTSRASKVGGTTIAIDPTRDPKTIDFLPADDPEGGKDASRTIRGIYQLEKDTLRICFNPERGGARPTDFATKAGSRVRCVTLKRKAPATTKVSTT